MGDLPFVRMYLDHVVVLSNSLAGNVKQIQQVVGFVAGSSLEIKPSKCEFGKERAEIIGYVIDEDGACINPKGCR